MIILGAMQPMMPMILLLSAATTSESICVALSLCFSAVLKKNVNNLLASWHKSLILFVLASIWIEHKWLMYGQMYMQIEKDHCTLMPGVNLWICMNKGVAHIRRWKYWSKILSWIWPQRACMSTIVQCVNHCTITPALSNALYLNESKRVSISLLLLKPKLPIHFPYIPISVMPFTEYMSRLMCINKQCNIINKMSQSILWNDW